MNETKPPRVKAKAFHSSKPRPALFSESGRGIGPIAGIALMCWLLLGVGCGGVRRIDPTPTIDLRDPPTTDELTRGEPMVDPYAELLEPTRLDFQAFGYCLRPPLGWREPEQRATAAVDLNFVRPGGGASITILRDRIDYDSYSAWVADMRTRLDLLDDKLSEVRLQGWRIEARGGYFLFRIDHLHQIRGEYYTSRKVLIYGGDVIVTIDFNAETALADGLRPAFDAFLDTFQLNDPAAARLLVPEDDFVAEFKVPSGHLTIPVPRHFVRDDVAQSRTILARWSLARNVTLTLAQHGLPSIGLVPYGEYQIGVLADAGHSPGERGVVEFGDHTAYRIEFTTKAGTPGLFFVLDAQSRYYQLIFTADPVSYEMLAPVADAIVAKARLSPA